MFADDTQMYDHCLISNISPFSLIISPLVSTTCKSPFPHTVCNSTPRTKTEFILVWQLQHGLISLVSLR